MRPKHVRHSMGAVNLQVELRLATSRVPAPPAEGVAGITELWTSTRAAFGH